MSVLGTVFVRLQESADRNGGRYPAETQILESEVSGMCQELSTQFIVGTDGHRGYYHPYQIEEMARSGRAFKLFGGQVKIVPGPVVAPTEKSL